MRVRAFGLSLVLYLDVLVPVARAPGPEPRRDELVDLAVQDALRVARAVARAQVLHHLVGLEHVAAYLAPPPDLALLAVEPLHLAALLIQPLLVEPGLEDAHRARAVLDLRALVLADDDDAARDVREAHRRIRRVDALPALARGAVNVDADLALRDLDLDVLVDLGDHVHGAERGVPPLVRVKGADPDEPVHAALGLGVAVGVLALDDERRLRDAGLVPRLDVLDLDLEAAALRPAVVHAQQHVAPVAGLGAARSRLYREERVVPVELAGEERRDLQLVELVGHGRDAPLELLLVGLAVGAVQGLHELQHDIRVVDLLLERDHGQDAPLEHVQLGYVLLGPLVVVPEGGFAHLGLHRLYLPALLVDVKETSTSGRRAS